MYSNYNKTFQEKETRKRFNTSFKKRFNEEESKSKPLSKNESFSAQHHFSSSDYHSHQFLQLPREAIRLYQKVVGNDTLTIKKSGDPFIYLSIVAHHFAINVNN
jgi:hypothetical protein